MAATKTVVQKAGEEIGDLVNLLLDEISNKEQITKFATEGFEAVQAVASVGIPSANRAAVATNLVEGLMRRINEGEMALPEA
jgi:hypothetical protein